MALSYSFGIQWGGFFHSMSAFVIWYVDVFYISSLEKEKATHSSILAWKIPWTAESHGPQSTGSKRVRHNWATEHSTYIKPWLCCCMCAHYAKVIPNHKWFIHSFIRYTFVPLQSHTLGKDGPYDIALPSRNSDSLDQKSETRIHWLSVSHR